MAVPAMAVPAMTVPAMTVAAVAARLRLGLAMRVPALAVAMTVRVGAFRGGHSGMKAQLWQPAKAGGLVSLEVRVLNVQHVTRTRRT